MKNKVYKGAPLPFMGQKRKFLKEFTNALKDYPKDAVYVDLFGGSGLLSHTVKHHYPDATVIYNDYDNYRKRIKAIPFTNVLISKIRLIAHELPRDKRITGIARERILKLVATAEKQNGYVDYITLSSSLLFSMKYVLNYDDLVKSTLYNTVRKSNYEATGYLEGLQVVNEDYKVLFDKYKDAENVIFLVDPPYLQTNVSTYKNYWSLKDYLDVLQVLKGTKYFYFTSNKSSIIELCEWIGTQTITANPFDGSETRSMTNAPSYNTSYTDIMLFK